MSKQIKPTPGYCVITRESAPETSAGGIIVAPAPAASVSEGIVVEVSHVSTGALRESEPFHKGDKIVHKRGAGQGVKVDGVEYLILSNEDILVVIK
jgi:chaperonin GroES